MTKESDGMNEGDMIAQGMMVYGCFPPDRTTMPPWSNSAGTLPPPIPRIYPDWNFEQMVLTSDLYGQGYRKGFQDGFERGMVEGKVLVEMMRQDEAKRRCEYFDPTGGRDMKKYDPEKTYSEDAWICADCQTMTQAFRCPRCSGTNVMPLHLWLKKAVKA